MAYKENTLELLGIGIGPNNLGLSALLAPTAFKEYCFFDSKSHFEWHPGLLFPEATMQVSFLKDLVTMVDPTNANSFLAFLADKNRLYRHANSKSGAIKRYEFNQYYQWVVDRLKSNLKFGHFVENIDWNGKYFEVFSNSKVYYTKNLVLGSGLTPKVPQCMKPFIGNSVFHAINYLNKRQDLTGKRVVVVGGGQSGAEIARRILQLQEGVPDKFYWVTSRQNYMPIDDTPFANEYFSPAYSKHYNSLNEIDKKKSLKGQILASDGIDELILDEIYQALADITYYYEKPDLFELLAGSKVVDINPGLNSWRVQVNSEFEAEHREVEADIIILATGFEYKIPPYMNNLKELIYTENDRYIVNDDYSIAWEGAHNNAIYVQNAALHQKGIADPNLSLSAWRNAKIINALSKQQIYNTQMNETDTFFNWGEKPRHASSKVMMEEIIKH